MPTCFPAIASILSPRALSDEILPRFGIGPVAECQFFSGGFNHTYRVKAVNGKVYYLRVYRIQWRTLEDIRYELDVLEHLKHKGFPAASPVPYSWSIRQIIHHVADGDDLWKTCIKAALGNPEGLFTLQWYWDRPQTEWAESWIYARRPVEPSLALLRANRHHIVDLLQRNPATLEKSIRIKWPGRGEEHITIRNVVEMQTRHIANHIAGIQSILNTRNQ